LPSRPVIASIAAIAPSIDPWVSISVVAPFAPIPFTPGSASSSPTSASHSATFAGGTENRFCTISAVYRVSLLASYHHSRSFTSCA
jgi:hypothetical protein